MKRKLGLLPTPVANVNRKSRRAMTGISQWSAPGLEQTAELVSGILPREFESEEEIPGSSRLFPTPAARDSKGPNPNQRDGGPDLPTAAGKLLPTPRASTGGSDFAREGRDESGGDDLGTAVVKMGLEQGMTLLPTPNAYESDPSEEFLDEIREGLDPSDPNHRLYLEDRKWMSQRTLSRVVPALLPTPTAEDSERGPDESSRQGGTSLEGTARMLPTPQASDASGGRYDKTAWEENEGRRPSGAKASKPLGTAVRMLPTPTSSDGIGSRRSTARTEEWTSNTGTTLTDAALESTGESTAPQSDAGKSSSGGLRLSPSFVEWLMGAPDRWTDPDCLLSATEFSSRPAGSSALGS